LKINICIWPGGKIEFYKWNILVEMDDLKEGDDCVQLSPEIVLLEYDEKQIKIVNINEDIWVCAKDVAKILGYRKPLDAIGRHVRVKYKISLEELCKTFTCDIKANTNQKNTIYTNKLGLIQLLIYSKMPNKDDFIKWCKIKFDIEYQVVTCLYKEQETVGQITRAFRHTNYKIQYKVDKYRIDLYFIDYKIAIECDEFNHKDRDRKYEIERETFIKKKLGCKFIRYNPDDEDFSVFDVINEIIKLMCK
jgi:very-short-patch-repair endonuclease